MVDEIEVVEEMPVLRKNRMTTGIREFDIMLEGGYKHPGNILLIGPSGMEKMTFSYHFADAAADDENVYFICSSSTPEEIIKKAATCGIDLKKPNVKFIDCYSTATGAQKTDSEQIKVVPGPRALNDLSLALNEAMGESRGKRMRVIFHTLSVFVLYNTQESIQKFIDVVGGRLKAAGATTLYLVEEGVHEKQLMGILERVMDEKYSITEKNGSLFLELPILNFSVPFKQGPAGIVVL